MLISRLFYSFAISGASDYHTEDWLNTKPDSMHMEEWYNGELLLGKLCSSSKLDKCEVTISYSNYTWIDNNINQICTCLSPRWPWCGCPHGTSFSNGSWLKQRIMGPKVNQITLWNQASD